MSEMNEEDVALIESVLDEQPATATLEDPGVEEPLMTDPEWSDFVMRHFAPGELDPNGRPLVHGLRRVAQQLLGPILESEAQVIQAPAFIPGNERLTLLQPAVVQYRVRLLMSRVEDGEAAYPVSYTDVADVYFGNTDEDFARYPTATAATRAEARCLRKMLKLRTVAAEEVTAIPIENASVDGFITPNQMNFLHTLCRRMDVNLTRFINSGKKKYARLEDIPFATAVAMTEHLSSMQNDTSKLPDDLRGYKG